MWQLAVQGKAQGIWFFASLYTVVLCVYSIIFQVKTRFWPFVEGVLIEIGVDKFGKTEWVKSNQDYVSNALYKYNVSGVNYEGTRVSPWVVVVNHNAKFVLKKQMSSVQQLPDGKIKVFFNPKKPRKSFLIIAGKVGICITALISILPLVLFYFKYYI